MIGALTDPPRTPCPVTRESALTDPPRTRRPPTGGAEAAP